MLFFLVPQFGLPTLPKAKSPIPVPTSIPNVNDALEYSTKVNDLVTLLRIALTDMGTIAVDDNPTVGAKIVAKLNQQIVKATQIASEFAAKSVRVKRDVKQDGDTAYNGVGEILVESNDKTQPEKGQLSPAAQEKMDNRHDTAVQDCKADVCKNHAEKRRKIKEAQAARKG